MAQRTGPTDIYLQALIRDLKQENFKQKVAIWKRVAEELEKPSRQRRVVNLSKIDRFCQDNDVVIVPGKVLASGELSRKVVVSSYSISDSALAKLKSASCTYLSIPELVSKNPKGKNIRIIG